MKREFIWIVFMLLACISASASSDENYMLREDRVWEYFRYEYKENYAVCALDRYGFTDTMEYKGTTYQVCELLSRTTWRTPEGVFDDFAVAEDIEEEVVGLRYFALR